MIVSLPGYVPPSRYDDLPWTEARLEQSATQNGTFTTTETFTLDQDTDPAHPATRSFTTQLGTLNLWYRLVWVDGDGDESAPTASGQNVDGVVTPALSPPNINTELAAIVHVNATSNADALQRVIDAAYYQIVQETGRSGFTADETALVEHATLAVAEDLWRQMKHPLGVIESEFGLTRLANDAFKRHAHELAPLKRWEGVA